MKFTTEEEKENKIIFLDITTSKEENNISFDIYRKPATTDTIIPNESCHPQKHKLTAIRYKANRMETYNLSATNKEKENNIIEQILYNNKYDTSILNKFTAIENKIKIRIHRKPKGPNSHMAVKKQNSSINSSNLLPLNLLSQNKTLQTNHYPNKITTITVNNKNAAHTN